MIIEKLWRFCALHQYSLTASVNRSANVEMEMRTAVQLDSLRSPGRWSLQIDHSVEYPDGELPNVRVGVVTVRSPGSRSAISFLRTTPA